MSALMVSAVILPLPDVAADDDGDAHVIFCGVAALAVAFRLAASPDAFCVLAVEARSELSEPPQAVSALAMASAIEERNRGCLFIGYRFRTDWRPVTLVRRASNFTAGGDPIRRDRSSAGGMDRSQRRSGLGDKPGNR